MQTPTSPSTTRRRWPRYLGAGATALVTVASIATTAGAASTTPSARPLGASGSVAALSVSSMEVQNPSSGQTTVNWTTTTAFSKTVTEAVSSLAAGDCVSVTGKATNKAKTTIAARSITVSTPTSSGTCGFGARTGGSGTPQAGGFAFRGGSGGAQGFGEGGPNGSRPSFPTGGSGARNFRNQLASLQVASGKVTAVKGSAFTVSGITLAPGNFARPSGNSRSNSKSNTKKPTQPKTQTLKITTTSSTTVNSTQSTSASALAVGDCVSAFGPAASNGAVTATTVRITSTGGGSCTGGGGFFGGGGFGGGGGFPGGPGGGGA